MSAAAIALSLFLQAQPVADAPPPAAEAPAPPSADALTVGEKPAEPPYPTGAPRDDYQLVAWCYGMLRGYLDLHDQVMPEVTRIETAFRPPGRKLSDDLKVYADLQKTGKAQLKEFQAALTAAEKASLRPINQIGAEAVAKGHRVWQAGPEITKARLAQEWMSWALPARCETTAKSLKERATLLGAGFKVNSVDDAAPAAEAPAAEAPKDAPAETASAPPPGGQPPPPTEQPAAEKPN